MTPIAGFAPDMPTTTPGVLTDCVNFVPSERGFESAPVGVPFFGIAAVPMPFKGSASLLKLNNAVRLFTSTPTYIYELVAGVWTARNSTAYATTLDSDWQFAQIGDASLAANLNEKIQSSTSGNFADISQAPKARIITVVNYHVVAFNINDGASKPAGWACSDRFDINTWTVSTANYADSGELLSTPGEIVAGGKLGDNVVAYKKTSIFIGYFVGSFTQTIDFREVAGEGAGCVGINAWCDIGDVHFIVGQDCFWIFDGSRPFRVGSNVVIDWFYKNSNSNYLSAATCVYEKNRNRVFISYPSKDSQVNDAVLVYQLDSKKWGRASFKSRQSIIHQRNEIVIDDLDDYGATIDDLPEYSFDSDYWPRSKVSIVFVDDSGFMNYLESGNVESSFTTGDFGDDQTYTMLTRARLRFSDGNTPSSALANGIYTRNSGGEYVSTAPVLMSSPDKKFDLRQSGRLHRVKFDLSGFSEVEAIGVEVTAPRGKR